MRTLFASLCLLAAVLLATAACSRPAAPPRLTTIPADSAYAQMLARAKTSGKAVLLDFTGSDWCTWCVKFDEEVLAQPAWKDWSSKHVEVLIVDFPHAKPLAAPVAAVNDALAAKYNVDGFPTFVLVDGDGKVLGMQVGYLAGGPAAFIAKLEGFLPAPAKP